ncbi:DNA repair protein RadC [Nitrosomonas oligotropha]|uniref:DNA repair protein RadC n=1 Tax=Nitrosomonas oligotropha TaxID=42354 RepID=A0A2T5H4T5_9PROT|nr:DNA repair protein RadC [Nitrosomonas oligotropha]PTQ66537.1 DNA repair protein RadC [Nitrosomonas oligotropha]
MKTSMHYASLSNVELLAKLIGVRESRLLYRGSLQQLFAISPEKSIPHEKCAVAKELVRRFLEEELQYGDALNSPNAVRDYLKLSLNQHEHEIFTVIFLDTRNRVIGVEEMFRGTLTQTSVYPREVVKTALQYNAAAVILAHNHPSGEPEPSRSDRVLTDTLKQALSLVDVKVLDHFIIAGTQTLSLAEQGLM